MHALPSLLLGMVPLLAMLLLLYGALHDVVARTIPDGVPITLLALGLMLRVAAGDWPWALLAVALVFGLGVLAWRLGLMGGGDVKLLAAVTALVPPAESLDVLAAIALAGGVLALLFMVLRRVLPPAPPGGPRPGGLAGRAWRAERRRIARGGPLPYAVAIAAGVLWVLGLGAAPP